MNLNLIEYSSKTSKGADGRELTLFSLAITVLMTLTIGVTASAQDRQPTRLLNPSIAEPSTVPSDVRDGAGMFTAEAARTAREALEKLEKATGVPVLIETIETLDGQSIDHETTHRARRSGTQGIYILIARKEMKIEVLASRRYADALPRQASHDVRAAFIDCFRRHEFDEGLRKGIEALQARLTAARTEGRVPPAEKPATRDDAACLHLFPDLSLTDAKDGKVDGANPGASAGGSSSGKSLVLRNQVRLTLEGARTIIAAATKEATTLNLKVNIAVVDDGGHLLSFDRMDGARPASSYTAITKATTAATFRQPTGPIPAGTASPDPLLNLSLQLAASASGGKLTTLYGGVPIVVDGQVVGGVGVGGGTGEQDSQVARAGAQALTEAISK
ncbi:MAG: heme-binding protein [Planctomycetaceae bacterium]|nr:heme-binding protein [Planctomycetaceae bacterium]